MERERPIQSVRVVTTCNLCTACVCTCVTCRLCTACVCTCTVCACGYNVLPVHCVCACGYAKHVERERHTQSNMCSAVFRVAFSVGVHQREGYGLHIIFFQHLQTAADEHNAVSQTP